MSSRAVSRGFYRVLSLLRDIRAFLSRVSSPANEFNAEDHREDYKNYETFDFRIRGPLLEQKRNVAWTYIGRF